MSSITILGSGSCNVVPGQAAASVLIEKNDLRLVFDMGRGVTSRLVEVGLKQDDVEHIYVSHFHPDHVTDLYPFLHAASWSQIDRRTKDLNIYGPKGAKEFITKMRSVFEPVELSQDFTINVQEVEDERFEVAGEEFAAVDLHHSFGLRFGMGGQEVAIASDSKYHDDLVRLLKDADLGVFASGHISDEEIVQLACATQAKQLICSHQYRELDAKQLNDQAREGGYEGELIVAKDLQSFDLNS